MTDGHHAMTHTDVSDRARLRMVEHLRHMAELLENGAEVESGGMVGFCDGLDCNIRLRNVKNSAEAGL